VRKVLALVVSLVAFGALAMTAAAAPGGTTQLGPFAGASQDGGSCGVPWANDTYNLFFTIRDNGNGTFAVKTEYKNGTFTTVGGASPGSCSSANNHGTAVAPNIKGDFQGWYAYTINSGSFNPNGCNSASCHTRHDIVEALFGPGADATQHDGTFNFEYNSNDKTLKYRHWQDKSDNTGADQFVGDIAN